MIILHKELLWKYRGKPMQKDMCKLLCKKPETVLVNLTICKFCFQKYWDIAQRIAPTAFQNRSGCCSVSRRQKVCVGRRHQGFVSRRSSQNTEGGKLPESWVKHTWEAKNQWGDGITGRGVLPKPTSPRQPAEISKKPKKKQGRREYYY